MVHKTFQKVDSVHVLFITYTWCTLSKKSHSKELFFRVSFSLGQFAVNSSQISGKACWIGCWQLQWASTGVRYIGRRLKPDNELNCTVISLTMRAELPVTNRKKFITSSTFVFPTNRSRYPKTFCSDMLMYSGSLITFNTFSEMACRE